MVYAHQSELLRQASYYSKSMSDLIRKEFKRLDAVSDEQMSRLKACEHIAEGEEGWEGLINECPSTTAVAKLRQTLAEAEAFIASCRPR